MDVEARIERHLEVLVEEIGARPPGSPANRRATDYLVQVLHDAGLAVDARPFSARWWQPGPARLTIAGETFDLPPAPFSRPCDLDGLITRLSSEAGLARLESCEDRILVIDGELTAEPLFPKAFPFLDLPDQRARIAGLERLRPLAVIAVVGWTGAYSFFEDPDLAFPYAIVDRAVGGRLTDGDRVGVRIGGTLHDGEGVNVAARPAATAAGRSPRTILCAHVDSKVTTPGAFDNAGGVATLLALAESGLVHDADVELVFFNGEDHYAAPGEQAWLAAAALESVSLAVNVDGAGVVGRGTAVSPLACPAAVEGRLAEAVAARPGWSIAPPWYESDHAIFAMRGIPSLAITSEHAHELLAEVAHTAHDTLEMVDPSILAEIDEFLAEWLAETA